MNDDQLFYDGRGVNSVQILAYLGSAFVASSHNETYRQAFELLFKKYQYEINIINAKVLQPTDINYSDDNLLFMPYLIHVLTTQPWNADLFRLSMQRYVLLIYAFVIA